MHGTGFSCKWGRFSGRTTLGGQLVQRKSPAGAGLGSVPPEAADSAADEAQRVDLAAVLEHLEVHVRAGRTAGRADEGDRVAARHGAAHAHREAAIVTVAGDQAVAIAHLDEV